MPFWRTLNKCAAAMARCALEPPTRLGDINSQEHSGCQRLREDVMFVPCCRNATGDVPYTLSLMLHVHGFMEAFCPLAQGCCQIVLPTVLLSSEGYGDIDIGKACCIYLALLVKVVLLQQSVEQPHQSKLPEARQQQQCEASETHCRAEHRNARPSYMTNQRL